MKRTVIEVLLILMVSLFLSGVYTVVSPEGTKIFKKAINSFQKQNKDILK